MSALHFRGISVVDDEPTEFWVVNGVVSTESVAGAQTLGGWVLPGLVDAHCHIGIKYGGGHEDLAGARAQADAEVQAGVLLVRDAGSPIDTRPIQAQNGVPTIMRAGRHIALPKRYIPGLGIDLDDESQLPETVASQARDGDGWVKLVGDWIDREVGDLAPLWSDRVLAEAIAAAHAEGARVTAHVFGEDALPGLIDAGIDCIEHGCGLTDETIARMAERDVALVPTLINIEENFLAIADSATRYPVYAAHMRDLHKRAFETVAKAVDAGVRVYAGTDAGGLIEHGRVGDEITALGRAGLSSHAAIGSASWAAREWLGHGTAGIGERADFVVYASDPRRDTGVLSTPSAVVLGGELVAARGSILH